MISLEKADPKYFGLDDGMPTPQKIQVEFPNRKKYLIRFPKLRAMALVRTEHRQRETIQ